MSGLREWAGPRIEGPGADRRCLVGRPRHVDGPPLGLLTPDSGEPAGSDDLSGDPPEHNGRAPPGVGPLGTYADWRERHYRLAEERRFERVLLRRYERVDRS